MYEGHFQLDRRPFAATPDPGCCYLSPSQTPLFQTVSRCIENGQGIAILTGTAGIGKTLLAQVLLAESAQRFTTVYLGTGQFPTRRALLQAILYELGQPYGGMTDQELRLELNTALRNLIAQRDGLLLILDEAHLLSDRLLEEIRLLADLAQHGVPLMRVVLSGNPEFEERLTSPALAAFNQRVACHVALETLTQQESISYLEYRVQWAGGSVDRIFEREALQLMAYASDGVPRCLNQLADHSLMQAYLAGSTTVSATIVRQALMDVQHLSLRWNPSALHERSTRPAAAMSAGGLNASHSTGCQSETSDADSAFEVGSTEERETACFEFGAGDNTPAVNVTTPSVEVESTAFELGGERTSQLALSGESPAVFEFGSDDEHGAESESELEDSEDEDGPPLFAWLAKPATAEPVVTPSGDNYASSSFTIPTRGRARTPSVEHEFVSTAPLTGKALTGSRRSEPIRAASAVRARPAFAQQEFPAEEIVIDGYARLDAPLSPMFPRPAPALPVPVYFTEAQTTIESAEDISELIELVEVSKPTVQVDIEAEFVKQAPQEILVETVLDDVRAESRYQPLDRIDEICSLIEESDHYSSSASGVELITDYGVERVDVDLQANAELPAGVTAEHQLPIDLEDWIGSTVVEVGRDLQQNMAASFPELVSRQRATKLDQLLDGIERASRFDVVEPDAATMNRIDGPVEAFEASEGSGAVPAPKHSLKNFFSGLRRRQVR